MLADVHSIVAPLPWQENYWAQLLSSKEQDHLPHGLLLRGPQGTGKGQFALAFAQTMLCDQPSGGVACGQCKSCQLLKAGTHPDLLLVEPEEAGKAIKIDQIRQVLEFSSKSAQFGGYRVILICPAEAMNVNASNALLKCLEEPGVNTLLLLVSHQISGVLATIRSRCQSIDFPIPPGAESTAWLSDLVGDEQKASQLLSVANGAPVTAVQLNDRDWLKEREAIVKTWIAVFEGKLDPVKAAETWQSFSLLEIIHWLLAWQIDYSRFCVAGAENASNRDLIPFYKQLQARLPTAQSHEFYDYLIQVRGILSSQANPNLQLLIEALLIKWAQLGGNS
ncbi:MAG: DNA polymerase III subunit delta' [Pseudomonadales bacterium]|nr:DNA polymerase III subunit delta' [Pseudomonadales bacterium]